MTKTTILAGLDVSKAYLDIHLTPHNQHWRVENSSQGHAVLIATLKAANCPLVALEATGGYERAVMSALEQAGIATRLINPQRLRAFAHATGQLAKTDKLDAKVIAYYARTLPQTNSTKLKANQSLRQAIALRRLLTKQLIALANHHHQLQDPTLKAFAQEDIDRIKNRIKTLERLIQSLVDKHPQTKALCRKLLRVPGIGKLTAATLIAQMPELGHLSRRQAASLAGLAPVVNQSGKTNRPRAIAAGRKDLRKALYMPALCATRFNPKLKAFYQRLIQKGKKPKVAIIAVMRKLLTILNAIAKDHYKTDNSKA